MATHRPSVGLHRMCQENGSPSLGSCYRNSLDDLAQPAMAASGRARGPGRSIEVPSSRAVCAPSHASDPARALDRVLASSHGAPSSPPPRRRRARRSSQGHGRRRGLAAGRRAEPTVGVIASSASRWRSRAPRSRARSVAIRIDHAGGAARDGRALALTGAAGQPCRGPHRRRRLARGRGRAPPGGRRHLVGGCLRDRARASLDPGGLGEAGSPFSRLALAAVAASLFTGAALSLAYTPPRRAIGTPTEP